MKIWLIAVMVVLALIAVDITVRIGWDRFSSGIGSFVDGQRHAAQVSPSTAQPRTTPHRREPPPEGKYTVAGAPEGWYAFYKDIQQCASQEEAAPGGSLKGPAEWMALHDELGEHYTMEDVMERGQVVQTTMRLRDTGRPMEWIITWYRGRARCEQAQRTKRQAQEQQREKYR